MLKIRTSLLPVALMAAGAFAAPAQASELVKLGKLIVTGKRAPDVRPVLPSAREPVLAERGAGRPEPERAGVAGQSRSAADASGVEAGVALDPSVAEPAPRPGPATEPVRGEPVSRAPAPPMHG